MSCVPPFRGRVTGLVALVARVDLHATRYVPHYILRDKYLHRMIPLYYQNYFGETVHLLTAIELLPAIKILCGV